MARKKNAEAPGLLAQIRQAIKDSGRSLNQLGEDAGVDSGSLSRFMKNKRDLQGSNLEKICRALGLRLVPEERPKREGVGPEEE